MMPRVAHMLLTEIAALFIPAVFKIDMRDDTPSARMRNDVCEDR